MLLKRHFSLRLDSIPVPCLLRLEGKVDLGQSSSWCCLV